MLFSVMGYQTLWLLSEWVFSQLPGKTVIWNFIFRTAKTERPPIARVHMLITRMLKGFSKKRCNCFWVSQAFSLTSWFQLEGEFDVGDKCLSCNPVYSKKCAKYLFLEHRRIKQQEIVFSWCSDSKALSRFFSVPHPTFAQPASGFSF